MNMQNGHRRNPLSQVGYRGLFRLKRWLVSGQFFAAAFEVGFARRTVGHLPSRDIHFNRSHDTYPAGVGQAQPGRYTPDDLVTDDESRFISAGSRLTSSTSQRCTFWRASSAVTLISNERSTLSFTFPFLGRVKGSRIIVISPAPFAYLVKVYRYVVCKSKVISISAIYRIE